MKNLIYISTISCVAFLLSCGPRIDLDKGQFGDHAYLNNVQVFTITEEEHELQEYYTDEVTTTGIRRNILTTATTIDSLAATASIMVPSGTDLTNVGVIFNHRAEKIEPIGSAPTAGFLDDFSAGPYQYRLFSADGTQRDWSISFEGE